MSQAKVERFVATEEEAGSRIDVVVAARIPDMSRNRVQKLLDGGHVLVNEEPPRRSSRVEAGDEIEVTTPEPGATLLPDDGIAFDVIHEGAEVIAVDKPAGLAVHPGAGRPDGTLVNGLLARYPEIVGVGGAERPGIVHRLDMDTSGVLLVARSERAYQSLVEQFGERGVEKTYLALVEGRFAHDSGVIEAPIKRSAADRRRMEVDWSGKAAVSEFRTVGRGEDATFLELRLVTGRTHQARVHLAAVGHPVRGDLAYGDHTASSAPRQMLHAWRIAADLPDGGRLTARAGMPADMVRALAEAGLGGEVDGYGMTDWLVKPV